MSATTENSKQKGRFFSPIGTIVGIVVFVIGMSAFPAPSAYYSDTTPRMLVLACVAGVASGMVSLLISFCSGDEKNIPHHRS